MDYKKLYLQKKKEYKKNKNIITGGGKASRKRAAKAAKTAEEAEAAELRQIAVDAMEKIEKKKKRN